MLIAGDIGGTKTLLGLYEPDAGPRAPVALKEYHSAAYGSLEEIVQAFLADAGRPARAACFDVAGPVMQGRAQLTNLPWLLDEAGLAKALGLQDVVLLNDLKAMAYAVPLLRPDELHVVNPGQAEEHGTIAVVAPGTGLGEAFLVWDGSRYLACSSEGGHADFAPGDATEAALWQYLASRFGHVSCERVCSGSGIPNLYDFLRDSGHAPEQQELAARLAGATDRTPLIVDAGLGDPPDPLSAAALDLFAAILGAEAGNLALKVLATGGVYLAGGMSLRVGDRLDRPSFMRAFAGKGRFANLLGAVPVRVVRTAGAALLGAAQYGLDQMDKA